MTVPPSSEYSSSSGDGEVAVSSGEPVPLGGYPGRYGVCYRKRRERVGGRDRGNPHRHHCPFGPRCGVETTQVRRGGPFETGEGSRQSSRESPSPSVVWLRSPRKLWTVSGAPSSTGGVLPDSRVAVVTGPGKRVPRPRRGTTGVVVGGTFLVWTRRLSERPGADGGWAGNGPGAPAGGS